MKEFIKAHFKALRTLAFSSLCAFLLLVGLPVVAYYKIESLYSTFSTAISSLCLYIASKSAVEAATSKKKD